MISIIHPSRGRPQKAFERYLEWIGNSTTEIDYILSLDTNDNLLQDYRDTFKDVCKIIVNQNRSLTDATNNGAVVAAGHLFVVVSDDFHCFHAWDQVLLKATEGKEDFVLKTFDGEQKWIVTLPIIDRAYYERVGYLYHPDYRHLFADTHQTILADLHGKLIIRNDIVFTHRPHWITKERPDDITRRSNGTYQQGEVIFIRMIRELMAQGYDVYKLSPEASDVKSNMIQWLQVRLKPRERKLQQRFRR